jgi:glycerophosphoryl diester phosphodiesterase
MSFERQPLWGLWIAVVSVVGCYTELDVTIPSFPNGGELTHATPVPQSSLRVLENMFDVQAGQDLFGDDVAVRSSPSTVSILAGKNSGYAAMQAGCLDGGERMVLQGYWRYANLADTGLIRFDVQPIEAARALCAGQDTTVVVSTLQLQGSYGEGGALPRSRLVLRYQQPLKPWRGTFFTIGHRGACGNTQDCGASANTPESIRLVEAVGGNAVELDVRRTKDGTAILYHDPFFSQAGSVGRFCRGAVPDVSYTEILANCRNRHGEPIATLDQGLQVALRETTLEGVYLDTKVPDVVPQAIASARAINDEALRLGRRFRAHVALTSQEVTDAWRRENPAPGEPPCILEYSPDEAIDLGCVAWAPTWTAGPRTSDVQRVRQAGVGVLYWTVNIRGFIDEFLQATQPNGILTNNPSLLFYRYQKVGSIPPNVVPESGELDVPSSDETSTEVSP